MSAPCLLSLCFAITWTLYTHSCVKEAHLTRYLSMNSGSVEQQILQHDPSVMILTLFFVFWKSILALLCYYIIMSLSLYNQWHNVVWNDNNVIYRNWFCLIYRTCNSVLLVILVQTKKENDTFGPGLGVHTDIFDRT